MVNFTEAFLCLVNIYKNIKAKQREGATEIIKCLNGVSCNILSIECKFEHLVNKKANRSVSVYSFLITKNIQNMHSNQLSTSPSF